MGNPDNQKNSAVFSPAVRLIVCLTFLVVLSGCVTLSDPEVSQEHNSAVVAVLRPGHTIGQSFVSRRPRLNNVTIWLNAPADSGFVNSVIEAALYRSPQDATPMRRVSLPVTLTANPSPINLPFDPLEDPPNQAYYLRLQVQSGEVQALGRSDDMYAFGTAYQDDSALPVDFAFSTTYRYGLAGLSSDLIRFLALIWLAFPLGLVLLLPGWLLFRYLHHDRQADLGEIVALSTGLSLAFPPVLMTWTTTLGLHWTSSSAWFAFGLFCAAGLYKIYLRRTLSKVSNNADAAPDPQATPKRLQAAQSLPSAPLASPLGLLLVVFAVTLAARLIMVRDLAAPPWVDSVHHATLTRLILEQGSLPATYAPYIQIDTASYHAGFHTVLAFFTWLSGQPLPFAMLVFGQVLNALIVFPVYLLTKRLTNVPLAGVFAALLAGLFTPMPAYYTSWGRYTQLASLLILPAAFALLQDLSRALSLPGWHFGHRRKIFKAALLAGLACAGLFLTHYRVAAFLACLLVSALVIQLVTRRLSRTNPPPLHLLLSIIAAGALAALLVSPWLPAAFSTLFIPKLAAWRGGNPDFFSGIASSYLTTAWGWPAMLLAGLGLLWGLLRRKAFPLVLILWCALMFLLANLEPLGLPGGGFVTNLSVAITLFMPVAVAGGFLIGDLVTHLESRTSTGRLIALRLIWGAALLVTGLSAAQAQITILRPLTFLARHADLSAIQWVFENIPAGETVLVNPVGWGYGFYQGQDGGYWIAPLAGRSTLPPPVLYGLDNDPERANAINQLSQQVIELRSDPPSLHRLLLDNEIHYIYLGVRGGILSPTILRESGLFELLYKEQGAWVFKLSE